VVSRIGHGTNETIKYGTRIDHVVLQVERQTREREREREERYAE